MSFMLNGIICANQNNWYPVILSLRYTKIPVMYMKFPKRATLMVFKPNFKWCNDNKLYVNELYISSEYNQRATEI